MTARILIVDDVPANTRLLQAKLTAEYYQIMAVHDGFDAVEAARTWQPDVILLDIMMPGMDGYQCCRLLKHDPGTVHIPVIMITALGEMSEKLRGLEAGADDFLTKPVEYETLMVRIRSVVRLKRLLDEWRRRGHTARSLGLCPQDISSLNIKNSYVIVVDDWDQSAELINQYLTQDSIFMLRARHINEAIQLADTYSCDLFVINLSLADEDALRLVAALRASDNTREIPLLITADESDKERLLKGLELGATDWLSQPIDENELRLRVSHQIRRKLYQDRLKSDVGISLEMALLDPLTGLYNRRYLELHLRWLLNKLDFENLSLLMVDVDNFKLVNDTYGHSSGDCALRLIAETLRRSVRTVDALARYGGEEFVVIMPSLIIADAIHVAERIRVAVEQIEYITPSGLRVPLTVSIGLACTSPYLESPDQILKAADIALYQAKRNGRNRVEVHSSLDPL